MTIEQAFEEFMQSESFKNTVKERTTIGSRFRVYKFRYNKGELKSGAMVELLLENGYEIKANKVRKLPERKS